MKKGVPKSLVVWSTIHFIVDILFGVPLVFAPHLFLGMFGMSILARLPARILGAALIGIGTTSLLICKKEKESFDTLLTLKIIWSIAAIIGIIITLFEQGFLFAWILLFVFTFFSIVWIYYKRKLGK